MKLLDTLTEEEKNKLKCSTYRSGEVVAYEDDVCEAVYIIKSGKITIKSTLIDGKEIVYNTFVNEGVFGNNLVFSDDSRFKGDVIAIEETEVYIVNKSVLITILSTNSKFLEEYLKIQSNIAKELNTKIKILAMNSARERFIYYLKENHNKLINKKINDIALEIGIERETLSRLISTLIKEKIIIKNNKDIYLKV